MQKIDYVNFSELNIAPFKATYILRPDLLTLAKSLIDFGFITPIIVQKGTNFVIDGNERVSLAKINKHVKLAVGDTCPVIYFECDSFEAQMMHLRLNRSKGTLLAKPTSKIILEDLDTTLSDLLDEVAKMKETLSSVRISLVQQLAYLNAKHQVQVTQSTYRDGRQNPSSKQRTTPRPGTLISLMSFQRLLSKPEEKR